MNLTREDLDIILTYLENGILPMFDHYGKTMEDKKHNTQMKKELIEKLKRLKDES